MFQKAIENIKQIIIYCGFLLFYFSLCGFTGIVKAEMNPRGYKIGIMVTIFAILFGLVSILIDGGGGGKKEKLLNRIITIILILIMLWAFWLFFISD